MFCQLRGLYVLIWMTHSALNRIILPGPVDFSENFDVFAAIDCGFGSLKSGVSFQVLLIFEVAMEASTSPT